MKKIAGLFFKGLGKIIDYIFRFFIGIVELLIDFFTTAKRAIGALFAFSGCFIFFLILNPFFAYAFFNKYRGLTSFIILAFVFPFIGTISVSYLKYIHYVLTEYFFDLSDYYLLGRKKSYSNLGGYGEKYREEQEKTREEKERQRREEEKKRFEESFGRGFGGTYWTFGDDINFEDLFGDQGYFGGFNQGQYQSGSYNQDYNQNYRGPYTNYGTGFKNQYEEACRTLGIEPTYDKYEIKLAFRKAAKKYHPDINKEAGAKEMFQKVNNAYEFLNEENIERYRRLKEQWKILYLM